MHQHLYSLEQLSLRSRLRLCFFCLRQGTCGTAPLTDERARHFWSTGDPEL